MPHSLSSKKRLRQNVKRRSKNRWRKDQVKDAVKAFDTAVKVGDKAKAAEALSAAYKKLDQVAAGNTIHKNTAARTKSRLARRLAKLPG